MSLPSFVLTALSLIAVYFLLTRAIHVAYRAPRIPERGTPAEYGLPFRVVTLHTVNGKRLFAWYIPAEGEEVPMPAVVIMHGWGANAEMMLPFAGHLHRAGYAMLLPDARNHGQSDGDSFSSMPRFAEDLESGFDWLAAQPEVDGKRIALLGHSVGAAAALLLASRRHDVAAVISVAAFAHPETMMRRQMAANRIPYWPLGWVLMRYIEYTIGHRLEAIAPVSTIRRITSPVLLVHGEADRSVPVGDVDEIYRHGDRERVERLTVAGADHGSVERIDGHSDRLIDFLRRALD